MIKKQPLILPSLEEQVNQLSWAASTLFNQQMTIKYLKADFSIG